MANVNRFTTESGLNDALSKIENKISAFPITEDIVTITQDATKGVAPYSTSYGMTYIEVAKDSGVEWVDGGLYAFSIDTKLVVSSAYRNVAIRIGEADDGDVWHPIMGSSSSILSGYSYFVKAATYVFQYKKTYRAEGALHILTDSNTTYSYLTNTIVCDSTDAPFKIDSNGYGARYSLLFATTPLSNDDGLVVDERYSSLVASSGSGTTKAVVTPTSGKFYIDRHPLYLYSANVAAGAKPTSYLYQDYNGLDLRYTANATSTNITARKKVFLWLKDFDMSDMSFKSDASTNVIVSYDKISTVFPEENTGYVYLYFLGWNTATWYSLTPAFTEDERIYRYTPSTGEMVDTTKILLDYDVLKSRPEYKSVQMPDSIATGTGSAAFGKSTASGAYSFAAGYGNSATSANAVAIGNGSSATGATSTAIGHGANASQLGAISAGVSSKASGMYSTTIGSYAETSGTNSLSIGTQAKTTGNVSTAVGAYTNATGNQQTVVGFANVADSSAKFIIGDGTGDTGRHNLLTVDSQHNAKFSGDVYAEADDEPKQLATQDYVNSAISDIDTSGIETIYPQSLDELLEYEGYKNCPYFRDVVKEETEDDDAVVMQLNGLIQIIMEYDYQLPGMIHYVCDYSNGYTYMFENGVYVNRYIMEAIKDEVEPLKEDLTTCLKQPDSGIAVGKYFRVASIDSDGHAVLEACDLPKASESAIGAIKVNSYYGTQVNNDGLLYGVSRTKDRYSALQNDGFVTKGTLENNKQTIVDSVLCSTATTEALTTTQQAAARARLGFEKEWVLKGTLTTDNKDTGVTVDLTGCTGLAIKGTFVTTGNISIFYNDTAKHLWYNALTQSRKSIFAIWEDFGFGFRDVYTKYNTSGSVTSWEYNANAFGRSDGFNISGINKIILSNTSAITSINLEIYAR